MTTHDDPLLKRRQAAVSKACTVADDIFSAEHFSPIDKVAAHLAGALSIAKVDSLDPRVIEGLINEMMQATFGTTVPALDPSTKIGFQVVARMERLFDNAKIDPRERVTSYLAAAWSTAQAAGCGQHLENAIRTLLASLQETSQPCSPQNN